MNTMKIKRIILTENDRIAVKDITKPLVTKEGHLMVDDFNKSFAKTSFGKDVRILKANLYDNLELLPIKAQTINDKDVGSIIVALNLGKESIVLEAGSGSGILTIKLANICKKIYTFENNNEHYEHVVNKLEDLEVDNVEIENKSIEECHIAEKVDAIILDLVEPQKYIEVIRNNLKDSGKFVIYLPNMNQVQEFVTKLSEYGEEFILEKVTETIEREWVVDKRRSRPEHQGLQHTAFLIIGRFVGQKY